MKNKDNNSNDNNNLTKNKNTNTCKIQIKKTNKIKHYREKTYASVTLPNQLFIFQISFTFLFLL